MENVWKPYASQAIAPPSQAIAPSLRGSWGLAIATARRDRSVAPRFMNQGNGSSSAVIGFVLHGRGFNLSPVVPDLLVIVLPSRWGLAPA
jgi:hypothetical protein